MDNIVCAYFIIHDSITSQLSETDEVASYLVVSFQD